jgi:hypothetical protein
MVSTSTLIGSYRHILYSSRHLPRHQPIQLQILAALTPAQIVWPPSFDCHTWQTYPCLSCDYAGPSQLGGRREVGVAQNHAPLCALCFVLLCLLIGASDVLPAHLIPSQDPFSGSANCEDSQSDQSGNSMIVK